MDEWVWVLHPNGKVVVIDLDDGDTAYHADLYPECNYFLAGVAPVPLAD